MPVPFNVRTAASARLAALGLTPPPGSRTERINDADGEYRAERNRIEYTQSCGGGCRILRKKIGND